MASKVYSVLHEPKFFLVYFLCHLVLSLLSKTSCKVCIIYMRAGHSQGFYECIVSLFRQTASLPPVGGYSAWSTCHVTISWSRWPSWFTVSWCPLHLASLHSRHFVATSWRWDPHRNSTQAWWQQSLRPTWVSTAITPDIWWQNCSQILRKLTRNYPTTSTWRFKHFSSLSAHFWCQLWSTFGFSWLWYPCLRVWHTMGDFICIICRFQSKTKSSKEPLCVRTFARQWRGWRLFVLPRQRNDFYNSSTGEQIWFCFSFQNVSLEFGVFICHT